MKDSAADLPEVHMRLRWIQLFEEQGNAGLVCLRCGISRPTLQKWLKRYRESGVSGLVSESRRCVKPLKHTRPKHVYKRYSAAFPSEKMQMDAMKVASGKYQYTLIDDFSRFVYAEIYPSKSAHSALLLVFYYTDYLFKTVSKPCRKESLLDLRRTPR